jgi:cell wall-associated NlpC family hydrolase
MTAQAEEFSAAKANQFQPVATGTPVTTGNTSLLPGVRSVSLQTVPTGTNIGTTALYRGINGVQDNVDRINALFNADMAARQASQQSQQSALGGSSYNPKYGDMNLAGQAYKNDGSLSDSRNRLMRKASSYIGDPYVLGGTSHQGIDCSGLVMSVYNKMGFNVSQHNATWQGQHIPGVRTSVDNLRPGDLVAWKDGSHIAIYAGNGEIIESANTRVGTVRRKLWANPDDVVGIAVRLPGEGLVNNPGVTNKRIHRQTETASGRGIV